MENITQTYDAMMRTHEHPLLLSTYEGIYICLAAIAVLLAGNAKVLLQHFGLISSSTIVGDRVSSTVGSGLKAIDTFSATPGLVTFITWGVIGLILFSLVQAFVKASSTLEFERELGSNRFVHPANFNRASYWGHVLLNTFLSFGLILLSLGIIASYILFVVPVASLYLQRFLIVSSMSRGLSLAISLVVISAGTAAVYLALKVTLWQLRATQH